MSDKPASELTNKPVVSRRAPRPWRLDNIIDPRALRVKLTAAAAQYPGDEQATRKAVLDHLHAAMFRGRMIAQERLAQGADGLDTSRLLSSVMDEVLHALYDFTTTHVFRARNPTEGERLSVIATGGYGRGVLAPSSDIDLLFLRPYKASPHSESVIEYMLYALWDMGLKVGHAFRTPQDCVKLSKEDVTIKTSILDSRFLFGDEDLAKSMEARFTKDCVEGQDAQFIADKLEERDNRHARQGDQRFVVEPNIKEGKGGLRDLQTLYWLVKHIQRGSGGTAHSLEDVMLAGGMTDHELAVFLRAARFMWTVRCHLHYVTGRPEERLSFDLQPEIASRLGYKDRGDQLGVERFMKRYFIAAKDVGGLTRLLAAKLEAENIARAEGWRRIIPRRKKTLPEAGFKFEGGRIAIEDETHFQSEPTDLLRLFMIADREETDIHPDAMTAASRSVKTITNDVRKSEDGRELFLAALLETNSPGRVLRWMNETDVLGRFLPEFGGIVAQTQFNMYHHFTVDEHTILAVEGIASLERGEFEGVPRSQELFGLIENRRALYLAMLLHDTGKGHGDQQVEGMRTSKRAAKRLGLDRAEVELIGWLVGNHLEMSETAQKRDISDPRTITQFANLVGSLERLRLLYLLTAADINAVGPGVWNAWKGQLLSELYHATAATLRGDRSDETRVRAELANRAEKRRMALMETRGDIPRTLIEMEDAYWTGFEPDQHEWHASVINERVSTRLREDGAGVSLLVSGRDRIGLFADLVGAISSTGANIVSAQVFTSMNGDVIDIFLLQDSAGNAFAEGEERRLANLRERVQAALDGTGAPPNLKPKKNRRAAAFLVLPSIQIRNDLSENHTVIDIGGRDRPGLLHDIAQALAAEDLSIGSAYASSYGERMFNAFYVKTKNGQQIDLDARKETLRDRLLAALRRDEPGAPETPAQKLKRASAADSF